MQKKKKNRNRITNMNSILNRDFASAREMTHDMKLWILAKQQVLYSGKHLILNLSISDENIQTFKILRENSDFPFLHFSIEIFLFKIVVFKIVLYKLFICWLIFIFFSAAHLALNIKIYIFCISTTRLFPKINSQNSSSVQQHWL